MKSLLTGLLVLGTISAFAGQCDGEVKVFNDSIAEMKAHTEESVNYLNKTADYVENFGDWINDQAGRKMSSGQGQTLLGSASMIRSNANTIKLTGKELRNNIVDAAQALINCNKTL
ncbi:MAG: hypothetical protein ACOYL6_18920 [Bacteriovoracaceae bacterium]